MAAGRTADPLAGYFLCPVRHFQPQPAVPRGAPITSSSRIAACPRTTVITGQPLQRCPTKGVQPQGEAIQLSSMLRRRFRSTMVKSAS